MGHAVRAATDEKPEATVLSIDGVGAYDHVHRSAMMAKLRDTQSLQGLLPFVRSVYFRPSCYKWSTRNCHDIHQHEGGEQGNSIMPLLCSLAIHDALFRVKENASWKVFFCALKRRPDSSGVQSNGRSHEHAGIELNAGESGTERGTQWRSRTRAQTGTRGVKILGTPFGSDRFVEAVTDKRLSEEGRLWEALGGCRIFNEAWQILFQCWFKPFLSNGTLLTHVVEGFWWFQRSNSGLRV